jgi:hypothetical protein
LLSAKVVIIHCSFALAGGGIIGPQKVENDDRETGGRRLAMLCLSLFV